MLHAARVVVQQMRDGAAGVGRQLDRIENDIRRLEQGVSRSTRSVESISAKVDEVQVRANEMAERLSDPWLHQLEPAQRRIGRVARPLNEMGGRLDGIDERIRAVGEIVEAEPRDTPTLIKLRDSFGAVCEDIQAAARLVDGGDEESTPLPGNPFDGRRLKDRRVFEEMKAELDVAIDASVRLRTLVDELRGRFDRLDEEARALQREVSERLESGGDLSDLRERFEHLCRAILTLDDPSAGA